MDTERLEIVKLKNIIEQNKSVIEEFRKKMEGLEVENYKLIKVRDTANEELITNVTFDQ